MELATPPINYHYLLSNWNSNYISDLSLVKSLKESAAQEFPRINSPPLAFTKSQTDSQYRPGFLQRSSSSQLSRCESPQQDIVDNTSNKAICESEIPTTQLYPGMNPCTKKELYGNKSPEKNKGGSCSVTGCLNEYFKDIVVVDIRDSGNLESVNLRQYDNVHISSNKTLTYDSADKSTDVIMVVGGSPEILDPSEEYCRAMLSSKLNAVEVDDTNGGSDKPNSLTVHNAVDEQQNGHSKTDNEGGDHTICGKTIAQLLQESNQSMQVPQEYNCDQTTGVVLNEHNILLNDSKRQCSMRRCLQFEEEHQNNMANNPGMCNQSHTAINTKIPSSVVHVGVQESSIADIAPAFCTRQLVNHRPTLFTFPNQNYGNSSLAVSRPFGIGLHLNSIVSAVPVRSSTGNITSAQFSYLNVRGKKSFSITGSPLTENARSFSAPSNVLEKLSVVKEESRVCRASSGNPSPGDKRMPIDERTDHVKAFTRSSPRKKRKTSSGSNGGDGCKLCNCKKSKCLKLYCDCFAAGIYCADPCSCQGCFNKPEYEDTVLEIRQKIESKNPLAFAPKVVQPVTELSAETTQEDINNSTPSSGRHKRGCSCKKSMCLKKYCECYQSSVGCSDGCRCEDCKNVFGNKEEYFFSGDNVVNKATNGRSEMMFEEKLENIANTNGFLQTELHHPYSSTPMTPVSQLSDREKDALKSLSPERYLPSQQFDLTMFASDPNHPDSIINSYNQDAIQETKYIVDVVSYDQELCFANSEEADDFSLHELGNRDSPSAQQKYPSVMTTTSVKVDDFSSHRLGIRDSLNALEKSSSVMPMTSLISSRTGDWTRSSQCSPRNGPFSLVNSIRWRGSPIIPTNLLGETKLSKVCDSDNKLYNEIEEDMPEILKDNLTPISALKSSSPNKKRVSPPHNRLHELGSSSSPGLRSGRKFILKSVPLSPPLTPCIDVKSNNSHDNPDCNNT